MRFEQKQFIFLVAVVCMLVDHVGIFFFDGNVYFRVIGRLALPVFCWGVGQAYIYSRDFRAYQVRLLVWAVVAQVPYGLSFGFENLNIIYYLFLGSVGLYLADRDKSLVSFLVFVAVCMAVGSVQAVLVSVSVILLYLFEVWPEKRLLVSGVFLALQVVWSVTMPVQVLATFALGLFLVPVSLPIRLPSRVFYAFYPLHFLGIYLLK